MSCGVEPPGNAGQWCPAGSEDTWAQGALEPGLPVQVMGMAES